MKHIIDSNINLEIDISLSSNKVYLNHKLIFEFSYNIKDKDIIPYIDLLGDLLDVFAIYYISFIHLTLYNKEDISTLFKKSFLFSISKTFTIYPNHTMICLDSNNINCTDLQLNYIQIDYLFSIVTNTSCPNYIYYFKI